FLQRLIEVAIVFGSIYAQIVPHFVPECAIEISFRRKVSSLIKADCRSQRSRGCLKNTLVAHDVRTQQDCAAVTARQIALIRKDRGGITAARLSEIRYDIVDANRNV